MKAGSSLHVRIGSKPVRLSSSTCFPVYPQQRTFVSAVGTSVEGQDRDIPDYHPSACKASDGQELAKTVVASLVAETGIVDFAPV
jgi:hypothetical protein